MARAGGIAGDPLARVRARRAPGVGCRAGEPDRRSPPPSAPAGTSAVSSAGADGGSLRGQRTRGVLARRARPGEPDARPAIAPPPHGQRMGRARPRALGRHRQGRSGARDASSFPSPRTRRSRPSATPRQTGAIASSPTTPGTSTSSTSAWAPTRPTRGSSTSTCPWSASAPAGSTLARSTTSFGYYRVYGAKGCYAVGDQASVDRHQLAHLVARRVVRGAPVRVQVTFAHWPPVAE